MPPAFTITKSYRDGSVGVRVALKARDWNGASVSVQGSADILTNVARSLAAELILAADQADAKIAKKFAEQVRREKWRIREINAGKIKVL